MNRLLGLALPALLAVATLAGPLSAATWIATPDGDLSLASNWLDGVPPASGDTSYIANGGAAWLNASSATPFYTISSALLHAGYSSSAGIDGTGTLTLGTGGTLTLASTGTLSVGYQQTGTLEVSGGSCTGGRQVIVGSSDDVVRAGHGIYNQTSGSLTCTTAFIVGNNYGVGEVIVGGGTLSVSSTSSTANGLLVGYDSGSTASGVGIMRQSAGTVTGAARIILGGQAGTYGYYELSGGSLKQTKAPATDYNTWIGKYGYGVVEQTGGTLYSAARLNISGGGGYGIYNLSGGTAYAITSSSSANSSVGSTNGVGVLNLSGTGLYQTGYSSNISTNLSIYNAGTVNLGAVASDEDPDGGGGTLYINGQLGAGGQVNFHGGTLKAKKDNAEFLVTAAARVYEEGAVVDTTGKNVTITAALQAPSGQGVTGITLANAGSGYTAPPVVVISGGGANASGATAIAQLNEDGNVDRIIITNPGVGYTETPTVTLYKGDGAGADGIGATVTLADNVSGGLTKKNSGTLTLSAANTYKGATVIEAGTLALAATGSIADSSTINVGASSFFDVSLNAFTLGGTQTLEGNGTVTGPASGNVTTAAGSHVRPGASIGTLTVTGNLAVEGTLDVEYNSTTDAIDMLAVSGTLDLTGATISFADLGAGTLDLPAYVFATYGTLAGLPTATTGVPTNYYVDYDHNNGTTSTNIALVLVPEPSIIALLMLSGMGFVLCPPRRRRR